MYTGTSLTTVNRIRSVPRLLHFYIENCANFWRSSPVTPPLPSVIEQARDALLERIISEIPAGKLNELTHQQQLE